MKSYVIMLMNYFNTYLWAANIVYCNYKYLPESSLSNGLEWML